MEHYRLAQTIRKGTVMDAFLILLLGPLAVMALPGLVFFIADWLSPVETHHLSRRYFDDVDQPVVPIRTGPAS